MILQLFKTIFCRFEYKLSFPLTKESPFLEPIERKLNSLMENGITEQIWRRNHYHSLVENNCEKPNVITVYNIFETILNENYVKKIFQLSLGYPQLTFPMAFLTFGLFISIVLASLEKLLHRPKTNFITLLDHFYSF